MKDFPRIDTTGSTLGKLSASAAAVLSRTLAKHEDAPAYAPERRQSAPCAPEHGLQADSEAEDAVIRQALVILARRLIQPGRAMTHPDDVRNYLRLNMAQHKSEFFGVIWLNTAHQIITFETFGEGGLAHCNVYKRQVVRQALAQNAAAAILVHNHPSGNTEPSEADKVLTVHLRDALAQVDVSVLDHFIVGGSLSGGAIRCESLREHGFSW